MSSSKSLHWPSMCLLVVTASVVLTACSDDTTGEPSSSESEESAATVDDTFTSRAVLDLFPAIPDGTEPPGPLTEADANDQMTATDCSLPPRPSTPEETVIACDAAGLVYRLGATEFGNSAIASAEVAEPPEQNPENVSVVTVTLTDNGAQVIAAVSAELSGNQPPMNQLAFVVDGTVVSAPAFAEPIEDGELQITGAFTESEAQELVDSLT